MILNRRKKNSLLILGLFLFISGLGALSDIFDEFNVYINNSFLTILSVNYLWILPTLLYLYVERVSVEKARKSSYLLLIPGGIDVILNFGKFLLPLHLKKALEDSFAYALFETLGVLFGLTMIFIIFRKIRRHSKAIANQYSSTENRELNWLYVAILSIMFLLGFAIVSEIFFPGFVAELLMSIFGLFITFWIAYNGLLQQRSVNLVNVENGNANIVENVSQEVSQEEKYEKQKNIVHKVISLVEAEKLYLNPELTIAHIADRVGEHPRTLSASINNVCKENFNRFINRYRVEEAKTLLLNKDSEHLNMEGIGMEAGFNSNSSFYGAFRKELNVTPLQFLRNSNS